MKTINETYKDFCKQHNLPTDVRVGNLSKKNTKLFLEYLNNMPDMDVRAVILWIMDEDYKLSGYIIKGEDSEERELSNKTGKFLKRKELKKYREISTPVSTFSIPIIFW